jgi:hypothetical protein
MHHALSHPFIDGRRESGSRRALDKVVNSLKYEMLLLMLLLTLTRCARSLSLARGWSWAEVGWAELKRDLVIR